MSDTPTPAVAEVGATLDARQVQELLPHRYPFLLVDRVLSVTADKIVALKNVSFNEPFFPGHFPGLPVMPGVLQIEALAQAAALLAVHSGGFDAKTQVMYFMAIESAKFRKPVTPGDQLHLEVVPLRKGRVWKLRGEVKVDGKLVTEAEFLATVAPREGAGGAKA